MPDRSYQIYNKITKRTKHDKKSPIVSSHKIPQRKNNTKTTVLERSVVQTSGAGMGEREGGNVTDAKYSA